MVFFSFFFDCRPDRHHCSHQDLRGTMQDAWEWVSRAEYNGTVDFEHRTVALWWLHVSVIQSQIYTPLCLL